ncbi:MAG: cell division protein FtsZ [Bacteroidetes bacterium]|nr:cell division protein FtsZ [Bacteroidota bacterium]
MNYFKVELPKDASSIIKVMGVGGGGSNAVNYMHSKGIVGVDFFLCNTDAQHLERSPVLNKIQLGSKLTEGLGAGGDPEFGKRCAMESLDQIEEALRHNTKMLFITAGMGGGTGTGAAPIIAQKARQMGILTIGIVTRPFISEGPQKAEKAEMGIADLKPHVDALLVISNERIWQMFPNTKYSEGLSKVDDILFTASRGIAEIITKEGYMNVDFRDVKTAMENSGRALMGSGMAVGDDRAMIAAQQALDSPLLDDNSIEGAKHILVNISFGNDEPFTNEVNMIIVFFQQQAGLKANLKFGLTHNENLDKELAITLVATGFENNAELFEKSVLDENDGVIEIDFMNAETIVLPIENQVSIIQPIFEPMLRPLRDNNKESIEKPNRDAGNSMDTPAYKRYNIELEELQQGVEVSKVFLEEEKENKTARFKEGGNKYLHDNVD